MSVSVGSVAPRCWHRRLGGQGNVVGRFAGGAPVALLRYRARIGGAPRAVWILCPSTHSGGQQHHPRPRPSTPPGAALATAAPKVVLPATSAGNTVSSAHTQRARRPALSRSAHPAPVHSACCAPPIVNKCIACVVLLVTRWSAACQQFRAAPDDWGQSQCFKFACAKRWCARPLKPNPHACATPMQPLRQTVSNYILFTVSWVPVVILFILSNASNAMCDGWNTWPFPGRLHEAQA